MNEDLDQIKAIGDKARFIADNIIEEFKKKNVSREVAETSITYIFCIMTDLMDDSCFEKVINLIKQRRLGLFD